MKFFFYLALALPLLAATPDTNHFTVFGIRLGDSESAVKKHIKKDSIYGPLAIKDSEYRVTFNADYLSNHLVRASFKFNHLLSTESALIFQGLIATHGPSDNLTWSKPGETLTWSPASTTITLISTNYESLARHRDAAESAALLQHSESQTRRARQIFSPK
jgi:hypothetical protein